MKLFTWLKPLLVAIMLSSLFACSDDMGGDDDVMKVSKNDSFDSHNAGQTCQDCHRNGGNGSGIFTVAGTVYQMNNLDQVYPNTTIHLYTQPNGQGSLVTSIEVDANGNFYTTADINWGAGLYTAVTSVMGTNYMSSSVDRGDCNSCHDNVTESRIFAN